MGRGTVSRVINGSPRVSDATRAAVEAAVAELGYVPNTAARALAANRTDAIALVVPEPETRFFAEPYFSDMLRGVGAELSDTRDAAAADLRGQRPGAAAGSPSTWPRTGWTASCWSPCTRTTRCPTCSPSWRSRP